MPIFIASSGAVEQGRGGPLVGDEAIDQPPVHRGQNARQFALITSSIRDEGTSYHLPIDKPAILNEHLFKLLNSYVDNEGCPYFNGTSCTTDAPYRETQSAIDEMKQQNISCVEMEASALYALSEVKNYPIICFAHLTNSMAQEAILKKEKSLAALIL